MIATQRGVWTMGRLFGIPVKIHFSLVLVLPLLAMAFSTYFRRLDERFVLMMPPALWGLVIAVVLFGSVLVHELAHALIAKRAGGKVRGITLLFIGGVTELAGETPRPRIEAIMAAAGPIVSLIIGGLFALLGRFMIGSPPDLRQALWIIGLLNIVLGLFNLIPAFPLDGGRVLRAVLTPGLGRVRATRAAATIGKILAFGLAVLALATSQWMMLIVAGFIFLAAEREAAGVVLDDSITHLHVGDVLPRRALPTIPVWRAVHDAAEVLLAERGDTIVVMDRLGGPIAALTVNDLKRIPPLARGKMLGELLGEPPGAVKATDGLRGALARMAEQGATALPVVDETGLLIGVLSREDVERELTLRGMSRGISVSGRLEPLAR
jgi:Zn-dependent protease